MSCPAVSTWVSASTLSELMPRAKASSWSGWLKPADIINDKNQLSLLNELVQRKLLAEPKWSLGKLGHKRARNDIWQIKLTVNDSRLDQRMVFDGEGTTKNLANADAAKECFKHIARIHTGIQEEFEEEEKEKREADVPKMRAGMSGSDEKPRFGSGLIDRGIPFDENFVKRMLALRG